MNKQPLVLCLANTVAANFTVNWASAKARRLGNLKALLAELRHWRHYASERGRGAFGRSEGPRGRERIFEIGGTI